MEITRIGKINLVNEVFYQLREMILSGSWTEGTKLDSENELARRFAVSRVVIREALQLLRGEKLIVTRQGVGTYVANPSNYAQADHPLALSEEAYKQFLQFRTCVELGAIELSKEKATKEDYDYIDSCVAAMRRCENDNTSYSKADFEFHFAIVKCAHNSFLERAMLANQQALMSILLKMNAIPESQEFGVKTHQFISDALRRKEIKAVLNQYGAMDKYNLTRLVSFFNEDGNNS